VLADRLDDGSDPIPFGGDGLNDPRVKPRGVGLCMSPGLLSAYIADGPSDIRTSPGCASEFVVDVVIGNSRAASEIVVDMVIGTSRVDSEFVVDVVMGTDRAASEIVVDVVMRTGRVASEFVVDVVMGTDRAASEIVVDVVMRTGRVPSEFVVDVINNVLGGAVNNPCTGPGRTSSTLIVAGMFAGAVADL
jgi:hypothetical protein